MAFKRVVRLSIIPEGQQGIMIQNLKIKFDVVKTWSQAWDKAHIQVFNMNQSGPMGAAALSLAGNKVILYVGYEDEDVKSLFIGNIQRAIYQRDGTETIWDIEAFDNGINGPENYLSLSFGPGASLKSIVDYILTSIGFPVGHMPPSIPGSYANGYSFAGKASDALTEVLAFAGLQYTISNQQICIFSRTDVMAPVQAIELNAHTGLLFIPEPVLDSYQKNGTDTIPPRRWKTKSIIFSQTAPGALGTPGTLFHLTSIMDIGTHPITGYYTAESVHFTGDNWDGDFLQETEMRVMGT